MTEQSNDTPILRIGVQPYLQTRPLWNRISEIAPEIEIHKDTPRNLAAMLVEGKLDAALLPFLTTLRNPTISIVPGIGLCSKGAAQIAMIYSRTAPSDIKTILLDRSAISGVAMQRAMFRIRWSMQPVEVLSDQPLSDAYSFDNSPYDAFLVEGEAALKARHDFPVVLDLGKQWEQWTSVPFVWSVWGVREGLRGPALEALFHEASGAGLEALEETAREGAGETGLASEECLELLRGLRYEIGEDEKGGIKRFFYYMSELKICPHEVNIEYYHEDHTETIVLKGK